MSKNLLILCFWVALMAVVMGCGKEESSPTIIKGRVIDNNTSEPIADASYYYSYSEDVNGQPFYTEKWLKTDSRGEFICTFPTSGVGPTISKEGYLSKDVGKDMGYTNQYNYKYKLTAGITNDVGDQRLYPKDGTFSLVLTNTTGNHKEVFGYFSSRIMDTQETPGRVIPLTEGGKPISVSQGETVTQVYKINAGDWVKIYWGYTYATRESNSDSFYVDKIGTTVHQINF